MTNPDSPGTDKRLSYGGSTAIPRIVNNFVHDISTGVWFACLIVIWTVSSQSAGVPAEAAAVLDAASRNVFWLLLVSLFGLAATGGMRLFYWRQDTPPEQLATKRGALVAKHAAFLAVYGLGTAWAGWMVFR